jgi:hypothetical protein
MGNDSLLAAQLKVTEQEKGRKSLIAALKAREETIVDRDDGMESDVEGMEGVLKSRFVNILIESNVSTVMDSAAST